MKLATYTAQGQTRTGIVVGDMIIDSGVPGTMVDLIRNWNSLKPGLEAKAATGGGVPLSSVRLEAPVQRPGKIFAIGLNYADHIAESKMETPQRQVWFTKAQTSVNGPYDDIEIAKGTMTNDYEVELVAIIGKGGNTSVRMPLPMPFSDIALETT
jgi:2-keto-4-pentenoate hydratase/2-oxohepta-3-ene-1,7-dioic acid hydratase in catechol pathway